MGARAIWLKNSGHAITAYNEFMILFDSDRYFSKRELRKWLDKWSHLKSEYENQLNFGFLFRDLISKINYVLQVLRNPEKVVSDRNEKYVEKDLVIYKNFFDSLESFSFTEDQRKTVIVDEASDARAAWFQELASFMR